MPEARVYSLSKAVLLIVLWTLAISGSATVGLFYRQHTLVQRLGDPSFIVTQVIQKGPDRARLPDAHYAALLGLDSSQAPHAYAFDREATKQQLLRSPWLADVELKRSLPDGIEIRPRLRLPIARLHNVQGALVDEQGYIFPQLDGEDSALLAELHVGSLPTPIWGAQVDGHSMELARQLLQALRHDDLRFLDLSDADSYSLGRREIIAHLGRDEAHYLRLAPSNWQEQLLRYRELQQALGEQLKGQLIDLRLDRLAYLEASRLHPQESEEE